MIPLALPPSLSIGENMYTPPHRGKPISYRNLQPGERYYRKGTFGNYDEIELVNKRKQNNNNVYRYRTLPQIHYAHNWEGYPMSPIPVPQAPGIMGFQPQNVVNENVVRPSNRFYRINPVQRGEFTVGPAIRRKHLRNTKRRAVNNVLERQGLSTNTGTGPANTVRKFLNLQPPKGAKGGRRTRKQKGGAESREKKVMKNTVEATKLGTKNDGSFIVSNLYYSSNPEDFNKGYGLVIAPRYGDESKDDIKAAKHPYEECLFFFKIDLSSDYPTVPPHFFHATPALTPANYRLHPNLYEHSLTPSYSGKVCLAILGTWGGNEWKSTMGFGDALQGIMGILEANPAMMEPGHESWTDKTAMGVLYNRHVLYEAIQSTSNAYEMVINAVLKAYPDGITYNEMNLDEEAEAALELPEYIKPFFEPLAKRAWSALGFLIGKLDSFIQAMEKSNIHLLAVMHHKEKRADFGALKKRLEDLKAKVPQALRKNVFTYGKGEIWRALFEISKPKRANGSNMTYNEFVNEQEKREEKEANAFRENAGSTTGNNELEYVYENENYTAENNGNNGNKKNGNNKNGNKKNKENESWANNLEYESD